MFVSIRLDASIINDADVKRRLLS